MSAPAAHSKRARPALTALAEADPALATLALWCQHRDEAVTGTQGSTITYGPDFAALAPHEQIGLAAHHILHVALRHPARLAALGARYGGTFDPALYNLAADAVVNETLACADYALPRPAVTLTSLLSESLDIESAPETALAEWTVDRLYFALLQSDDTARRARAHAEERAFRQDVAPEPGEHAGQVDAEEEARWRQQLARAMEIGRSAGRGIGRFRHRLFDIAPPRTPWERVLRHLLTAALIEEPRADPRRPSRRWIALAAEARRTATPEPGFEAGLRRTTDVPRIVVAVDASSSIDAPRLTAFFAEVTGIARRVRAELHLLVFDEIVHHRLRLDPAHRSVRLPEVPRGGGTDFAPVLAEAAALGARALVMLTDLEADPGPAPRGFQVFWAVPDGARVAPPYGRVIDLAA